VAVVPKIILKYLQGGSARNWGSSRSGRNLRLADGAEVGGFGVNYNTIGQRVFHAKKLVRLP